MAMLGEHAVAAIAPQPPEMIAVGAPPMWNTYLAVDSADDAAARAEAAGGTIAMAPFDVMDAGRMAFVLDLSGAPVALWQADGGRTHAAADAGHAQSLARVFGVADADATGGGGHRTGRLGPGPAVRHAGRADGGDR
jgi:hypothetical protein